MFRRLDWGVRRVLGKPSFIPPMLPSLVTKPPTGGRWIHEIKHDGYRTLLVVIDLLPAEPPLPRAPQDRPSIAVLPFDNLSDNREQE